MMHHNESAPGHAIQRPNNLLRQSVKKLAAGKVDESIPHADYPNEVGVMARAIGVLQEDTPELVGKSNRTLRGWANYFSVGTYPLPHLYGYFGRVSLSGRDCGGTCAKA